MDGTADPRPLGRLCLLETCYKKKKSSVLHPVSGAGPHHLPEEQSSPF